MDPVTVSVGDAARALGVSKSTAQRRINDGTLKTIRLGGRTLVTTASIRALVEELAA